MVRNRAGGGLGVAFVLIGGFLLLTALFTPWYTVENTASGGWYVDVGDYLGLPSWDTTIQSTCSAGYDCPAGTSYSAVSADNAGLVAEVDLFLVAAGSILAVIAGGLGALSLRGGRRSSAVVILPVAALVFAIVAAELYVAAIQFGLSELSSSFWGSRTSYLMACCAGTLSVSWGPGAGWYLSIVAAVTLLVGVVSLVLERGDLGEPSPSSPPSAPATAPATGAPAPPPTRETTPSSRLSRKPGRLLGGILAVVVVAVVLVFVVVAATAASWVMLTGQNWGVNYARPPPSYAPFYLGTPAVSPSGAVNGWTGSRFTDTLTLTSTDFLQTHNITSIAVAAPFSLSSVSPSLPVPIRPGGTVTITLTIALPPTGGSYQLTGTITSD